MKPRAFAWCYSEVVLLSCFSTRFGEKSSVPFLHDWLRRNGRLPGNCVTAGITFAFIMVLSIRKMLALVSSFELEHLWNRMKGWSIRSLGYSLKGMGVDIQTPRYRALAYAS